MPIAGSESGLLRICLESKTGMNPAIIKSSGAAGGLGAAFITFFPSRTCSGIKLIGETMRSLNSK